MQVQTLSVVTGSTACQAKCPFCVSKMTPANGMTTKPPEVNWRNFHKAMQLAKTCQVSTVILTGKGEPTLFPLQISDFLENMEKYEIPLIELQTNGLVLHDPEMTEYIADWYKHGLTMVNISVVSHMTELNQRIYTGDKEYPPLAFLIQKLHKLGLSVRLSVTMLDGYMSTWKHVEDFLDYARRLRVEQVTMRPVAAPSVSQSPGTAEWVSRLKLKPEQVNAISHMLEIKGTRILELPHGGCVYDVGGQNVCWTDCLTVHPEKKDFMRQLIFFPDGHLRYDWQHTGAVIF
jgi:MoaA/NifB/PqqE/SkfB family radical SAM enzyme